MHLQQNSIELLGDQALVGLTSLALLDLSRNNLQTMGPATLRPLVSLQVLRLTGQAAGCVRSRCWMCALVRVWVLTVRPPESNVC